MADLTPETNADLNRLAEMRAKGAMLSPLDEQRLRDHQLRRLRRLWLNDQVLTAREPLLPPKKPTLLSRWRNAEEAFWSRHLKFRTLQEYLGHGKDFNQIPKLWVYQSTSFLRAGFAAVLVSLPVFYFLKYGGWNTPSLSIEANEVIYPGDKYITVRKGDVKFDRKTMQYVPTTGPDDWQNKLI